jgi:DNA-binding XRE family transcriptional regulator
MPARIKVTPQIADSIRLTYISSKITQEKIGKMFGVSRNTVNKIVNNKR